MNCTHFQLVIDYSPNYSNEQLVAFVKVNETPRMNIRMRKLSKIIWSFKGISGTRADFVSPIKYHYRQFENPACLNVALRGNMNALKFPDAFEK